MRILIDNLKRDADSYRNCYQATQISQYGMKTNRLLNEEVNSEYDGSSLRYRQ